MEHAQIKSMAMSVYVLQGLMGRTANIVRIIKMQLKEFAKTLFVKVILLIVISVRERTTAVSAVYANYSFKDFVIHLKF